MSKFQFITLALFVIFIIVGVASFALYRGSDTSEQLPAVTIWGTFPADVFNQYVSEINNTLPQPLLVQYVKKEASTFSDDFIAALARGQGPDVILIAADALYPHSDKLALIPFTAMPQREFRDNFVQEAELYIFSDGIAALPFTLDPLIMYWNRDMFDTAGIAVYPRFWDQFTELNKVLTIKDQNGNIRKSAVAMGDFSNVTNARELLGTLFLQSGNPVTYRNTDGQLESSIKINASASPIRALEFFTKFVNPSSSDYSWNRGMPTSKSAFLAGSLATYFGFASELFDLKEKNPNLNFDAALIPQARENGVKASYARMYGFSIVHSTPNPNGVYQVLSILTAPAFLSSLSEKMYLPPVRRDLIDRGSTDPYISIFGQAALVSKMWLDADPLQSFKVFSDMVTSVTTGRKGITEAIQDAGDQYDVILRQAVQ